MTESVEFRVHFEKREITLRVPSGSKSGTWDDKLLNKVIRSFCRCVSYYGIDSNTTSVKHIDPTVLEELLRIMDLQGKPQVLDQEIEMWMAVVDGLRQIMGDEYYEDWARHPSDPFFYQNL